MLSNWQSYCIRLEPPIDARALMQKLLDKGIASRRGIMCAHREPAYQKEPWTWAGKEFNRDPSLGESEDAQNQCILLPMYHEMNAKLLERVVKGLKSSLKEIAKGC
jgi:dTDP-4-amino-4,6-dideoxygalactose transaminase